MMQSGNVKNNFDIPLVYKLHQLFPLEFVNS